MAARLPSAVNVAGVNTVPRALRSSTRRAICVSMLRGEAARGMGLGGSSGILFDRKIARISVK